jgi:aminopeptidase N
MSAAEITRAETRARAELVSVQGYEIELDVSRGDETFLSTTYIRFTCASPGAATYADLLVESAGEIRSITLNGAELDPAAHFADGRITLPALAAENTLRVVATLAYSTPGFHRSTDPVDGKVYTYTKFEPDHARRVFACFEQPDLKAPFTISVIAPADWTVIATQPTPEPTRRGRSASGLARWDFPPTPRLSTYLMHVTAGEYHVVRSSHTTPRGQTLPLALASRASLAPRLEAEADDVFAITRAGLDYFTALFDMDFPFAKYDQQFVPNYPAGATEHPAAVTIDDELLFRSRATAAEYEWRAEVDPARDGAHVVRRPRDHAVVGRPLAQRVLRRVGRVSGRCR